MVDSVNIFSPGDRLTDSDTGAPLPGGIAYFYNAGTLTPKTVYADSALTTALGTSVTADSLGYPTTDGTTKTLVYTDTASYKVAIKNSSGVSIVTHDNVKGAVSSAGGGATPTGSMSRPVVTKSLPYTVLIADGQTQFIGNSSSADVTFTLPSAVLAGAGWFISIQHGGAANECIAATVAGQTIIEGAKTLGTSVALMNGGEGITLISDGGNWRISEHVGGMPKGHSQGTITVISRTNTPPGSPAAGDNYIVTASPTGAWSGYAANDIAQYTGSAWINITPKPGWSAYVTGEGLPVYYDAGGWSNVFGLGHNLIDATGFDPSVDTLFGYRNADGAAREFVGHLVSIGMLLALIEDRKATGTSPGTSVATTWTTRDLNTKTYDRLGVVTVSANQFTLGVGNYEIEWETPFFCSSGTVKSRLQNITAGSTVDIGSSGGWPGGTGATIIVSRGAARVSVGATTTFAIQYWASVAGQTLGYASSASVNEIYTRVIIRRG